MSEISQEISLGVSLRVVQASGEISLVSLDLISVVRPSKPSSSGALCSPLTLYHGSRCIVPLVRFELCGLVNWLCERA